MSPDTSRSAVGFAEVAEFHVEVARRADPAMAERSLLVGGDPTKRGKVVAASEDLLERGIVQGMSLAEALDRAPEAHWVRTDVRRARAVSGELRAAVREEIEEVEVVGLAGFYMRAPRPRDAALAMAARLESRVMERTGLPLRIGIAPARFAARLAAEDAGRSGARAIAADEFEAYLMRQPVERLPGVGPKTAARLAELGAVDIPGLRDLGLARLEVLLGNHGRSLWLLACGEDPKPLRVKRHPSTLSREETLENPSEDPAELAASILRLAESLESALRRDGLYAGRIALRLTGLDERTVTRSCTLAAPMGSAAGLSQAAQDLLARIDLGGRAVRRSGLVLKGLEIRGAEDRQLDLF
jgi:DNA polymerase-4